jgi:hypothetical protein
VDRPTVDLALPLHLVDQADFHPHWTLEGMNIIIHSFMPFMCYSWWIRA